MNQTEFPASNEWKISLNLVIDVLDYDIFLEALPLTVFEGALQATPRVEYI